jgi:hypothetical protein
MWGGIGGAREARRGCWRMGRVPRGRFDWGISVGVRGLLRVGGDHRYFRELKAEIVTLAEHIWCN